MNKPTILVTGNGFDLFHGLPTSYMDFMNITNKLIKKSKGESIDVLFKDVNGIIKDNFNDNNLNNLLFTIENRFWDDADKNIWFQYFNFLIEKKVVINTWIDFENEIQKILIEVDKANNSIMNIEKPTYSKKFIISSGKKGFETKDFSSKMKYIEKIGFLITFTKTNIINPEYVKYIDTNFIEFDIDKYLEFLFNELKNFEKYFKSYLDVFVKPLIENDKINNRLNFFKDSNYQFIKHYNFNYTNTISNYQKENNFKGRHPHFISKNIHGKIDKDNIIFGIDDVESIKFDKNKYLMFTKYYRRLVERCDDSKAFIDLENIGDIKKVVFFGHSLDKSDKTYLEQLLNFIYNKRKDKTYKVELDIFFHNIVSQSNQVKNLIEIFGRERIEEMFRLNVINMIEIEK